MADDERLAAAVAAANAMTRRWIEGLGPGATALRGTAWPLLATLVEPAAGPARAELAAAAGIDGADATAAADALARALDARPALALALSAWIHRSIDLDRAWAAANATVAVRTLEGQGPVDEWVRDRTGGRIQACPITVDDDTLALLLCACAVDSRWEHPTESGSLRPTAGPWAERYVIALRQRGVDPGAVAVVDGGEAGAVTVVTLRTDADIDVRLAIAEADRPPLDALRVAVGHLLGAHPARAGAELLDDAAPAAPGLEVVEVSTRDPEAAPSLLLAAAAFDIEAEHDLLDRPDVFGLAACTDAERGHFPGLSPQPLAVGQAKQAVRCTMDHEGFRAAAVTAVGLLAGSAAPSHRVRNLVATFDRPYAFVAHDRATRLVLFAGVIEEPLADP